MAPSDWSLSEGGKAGKGRHKGKKWEKHINCPRQGCINWQLEYMVQTQPFCNKCGAKWEESPDALQPVQKEEQTAASQKLEGG